MTENTPSVQAETPAAEVVEVDNGPIDLDANNPDGLDTPSKPDNSSEKLANEDDATADPVEDEATADDGEDEENEEGEAAPAPKKRSGIARLKAQLAEAQAKLTQLEKIAPKASDAASLDAAVLAEIGPEPKEADFTDYLDFREEHGAWVADKRAVTRRLKEVATQTEAQGQLVKEATFETYREKVKDAEKSIPDIYTVLNAATVSPTHNDTIDLIVSSDKAAELSYLLAKSPKLTNELNAMSPLKQAKEIGRLEASLSKAKPKTETKAPAPVPPVKGAPKIGKDPDKMSQEEFQSWYADRKKQRG